MKKIEMKLVDAEKCLEDFLNGGRELKDEGHKADARYASFDYCFNYFQSFKDKKEIANDVNMQMSCLQLGFYLASWGMLRGSSFLLQKSALFYKPLIEYIANHCDEIWKIDVSNYTDENIKKLLVCKKEIKKILETGGINETNKDILITKIMLGVFGCIPAFDTYFKKGTGLGVVNETALKVIKDFYLQKDIQAFVLGRTGKTKTFEFKTGDAGKRSYTQAKIIDMIFFVEGMKK